MKARRRRAAEIAGQNPLEAKLDGQDLQKPHWQVLIAALLEATEECSNEAVQDATLELHRALSRDGLLK